MGSQGKMFPDLIVVKQEAAKESKPEPGLTRKVMAYNDKLFLAEHQMARGWAGSVHSHPHDQIVYVVHGHLKVTCQGKTFDVPRAREKRSTFEPVTVSRSAAESNTAPVLWKTRSS